MKFSKLAGWIGLLLFLLFAFDQAENWYAAYERSVGLRDLLSAASHLSEADKQIPIPCLRTALEGESRAQVETALLRLQKASQYSDQDSLLEVSAYCLLGEQQKAQIVYMEVPKSDPWPAVQRSVLQNIQGNEAEAQQSIAQANLNGYEIAALTQRLINLDAPLDTLVLARDLAQKRPEDKATWQIWLRIGSNRLNHGDVQSALQIFQEAVNTEDRLGVRKGKSEFLMRIGRIFQVYMKPADLQKALEYYELARKENAFFSPPAEGSLYLYRGEVFSLLNNQYSRQDALVAFQAALQLDPKCVYAALDAGNIYLNDLPDLNQARKYLEKAKELNPNLPSVYLSLGDLAQKEGNISAARESYQQALRLAPDSYAARQRLDALGKAQP